MKKLVDAEKFIKAFYKLDIPFRPSQIDAVFECLKSSMVNDDLPVIRCHECRFYDVDRSSICYLSPVPTCYRGGKQEITSPMGYCDKAKRREE